MATIFLVELDTGIRIRDWTATATGGVYTRTLDTDMQVVTRVEENGTALTETTSNALVDATASRWYYDPAARVLRVHTSDSGNANSKTMLVVILEPLLKSGAVGGGLVKDRVGAVNTHTLVWENRIVALPTVEQGITPDELGAGSVATVGLLEINNADGRYDRLIGERLFLGQQVRVYRGDDADAYGSFTLWLQALQEEPEAGTSLLSIPLVSLGRRFDGPMITSVFSTADYPSMDVNIIGFNVPKIWGRVIGAEAFRTCTSVWKLSSLAMTCIGTVRKADGTTVTVTATDLTNGDFTVSSGLGDTQSRLYADGVGVNLAKPGELLVDIGKDFGFSTVNDMDGSALSTLDTDRAVSLGLQVRTGSVKDTFDLIARSAFIDWFVTRSNTFSGQIRRRDQGNKLSNGTFNVNSCTWQAQRAATIGRSTTPVFRGDGALEIKKAAGNTVAHAGSGDLYLSKGKAYTVTLLAALTSGAATTMFKVGIQDGGVNEYLSDGIQLSTGSWTRVTMSAPNYLRAGVYAATTDLVASSTTLFADSIGDAVVAYPQHTGGSAMTINVDDVEIAEVAVLDDANAHYESAAPRGPIIWRVRAGYAFDGRTQTRRYSQKSDQTPNRLFPTAESRQIDGHLVCTTDAEVVAQAVLDYYSVNRIRVSGFLYSPERENQLGIGSVISLGTGRKPSLPGSGVLFRLVDYSEQYLQQQVPRLRFDAEAQADPIFSITTIP